MRVLRQHDVESLLSRLTKEETCAITRKLHDALRAQHASKTAPKDEQTIYQPERVVVTTKSGTKTLFMPVSLTTTTGIKIATVSPKGVHGAINIFDVEGGLLGILNAADFTAWRTAMAVMIAFLRWPRAKSNIVIFGAGAQAEWHLKLALLLTREGEVERVTVINRSNARRMEQLFADLRLRYPDVTFEALLKTADDYDRQLREVLASSSVIFGCTPSTDAHFTYSYLDSRKPRFIGLIGSWNPSMHEIDTETLLSGDAIYVDTKEGCLVESGEIIAAGVKEEQLTELGELRDDNFFTREKNVVFKCVGMGLMDITLANELLEIAAEKDIGLVVEDF
jgi:ornithine cyclodeaminase/alanine dehydrogenase-like protein (mu-crystallin family)